MPADEVQARAPFNTLHRKRLCNLLASGAIPPSNQNAHLDSQFSKLFRRYLIYRNVLGLELLRDHGWIATYGSRDKMSIQISFASQGGSGTPTPDLSTEIDDLDAALEHMKRVGFTIEYGPADEPWGVRRFYVRDPFGKLINILAHA